jgi:hypothetical protein
MNGISRYWLYTHADGSITVHLGGCHRRLSRTGPLTAEQVSAIPDYQLCRICLSENFTLSRTAAGARLLTDWKTKWQARGAKFASRPIGRSRRPNEGDIS